MNSTNTDKHFQLFLSNPDKFNAKSKMYHVELVQLINYLARTLPTPVYSSACIPASPMLTNLMPCMGHLKLLPLVSCTYDRLT
jgi:hypothetical protein